MRKRYILGLYLQSRRFFIKHPAGAAFLSHGFVHILGAVAVLLFGLYCFSKTNGYEPEFKQISIDISGRINALQITGGNHPVFNDRYETKGFLDVVAGLESPIQSSEISMSLQSSSSIIQLRPHAQQGDEAVMNGILTHVDTLSDHYVRFSYPTASEDHRIAGTIYGDNLYVNDPKNPYYCYYLRIQANSIDNPINRTNIVFGGEGPAGKPTPIRLVQVEPSNYTYTPDHGLTFRTQDIIENGGIYIIAEDINKKNKMDRDIFIYSVLVGASIAFFLDILVNLVVKWKVLAEKYKRNHPKTTPPRAL